MSPAVDPAANNTTKDVKPTQPADGAFQDTDLVSALNELTMLGQADSDWDAHSLNRPLDDSAVMIQGLDVPEDQSRQRDRAIASSVEKSHSESSADSSNVSSMDSIEALQDLASWADSDPTLPASSASAPIATDLLLEMQQAGHPSSSWLANSIGAFLLVVISGVAGWWLAKSERLESWLGGEVSQQQAMAGNEDFQQEKVKAFLPAAIKHDPSAWKISVTGQVLYLDESGQELPDGSALIYLLPASRQGNLKVHARSFQREPANADRRFSEAALRALGGLRIEADAEGRFQIGTEAEADEYQLIVVSRHRQRSDHVLPEGRITNALMPWFDSTAHVLGQRDSVMQLLSKSAQDLRITIGSK